ncbi:MAG: protein tyrosine phosphatase family protein [Acidobacteria bacterium]|nr:protein tyrosine phosphatase family protein [Acidobacteriota bacterium]
MASLLFLLASGPAAGGQQGRERLDRIQEALKDDIPKLLCIDEDFATAGQPSEAAFAKLAANGFRSVLNLRTPREGFDLERERQAVEYAGLRYLSIPVESSAPEPEQADQFLELVGRKENHPMLIHCSSANRVGAFWMIHRILDQGWNADKALEEATRIGLSSPVLKQFALDYVSAHR